MTQAQPRDVAIAYTKKAKTNINSPEPVAPFPFCPPFAADAGGGFSFFLISLVFFPIPIIQLALMHPITSTQSLSRGGKIHTPQIPHRLIHIVIIMPQRFLDLIPRCCHRGFARFKLGKNFGGALFESFLFLRVVAFVFSRVVIVVVVGDVFHAMFRHFVALPLLVRK